MNGTDAGTARERPSAGAPIPPAAERRPHVLEAHGRRRVDDYYWLRDDSRSDPDVIAYLEAENAYVDAAMAPLAGLREQLFAELKSRIRPDEDSVPYRDGNWIYQTRYAEGLEYPIYVRWPAAGARSEQTMLDVNRLAAGHDYYDVGELAVSEGGGLLAYAEDVTGREEYVVRLRDLGTGRTLADAIPDVSGDLAWANDERTLFYIRREPATLIPNRVYRHVVGTDPATDVLVYEERDPEFYLELGKSRDGRWIVIHASQTLADEHLLIDADAPTRPPRVVIPRERGHEYVVEPAGDRLFILTNRGAPDGRLVDAPLADPADEDRWRELLAHRPGVPLEAFAVFDGYVVVNERVDGLLGLRVIDRADGTEHVIDGGIPAATTHIDINPTTATRVLRYATSSMATPEHVVEYDLAERRRRVLRVEEVPGGFDAAAYETEMRYATARDGERVPVTLLWRRGRPTGPRPLALVGYGAYGISYDPEFRSERFSLVDRGFVYAIAHVRGGQERGRRWYDEGRLLHKQNSFTDFIDVTKFLIDGGIADPDRIVAMGRSAGGLLMGAVANLRPDLYAAIVAGVPFVDAVTGMSDPTIPIVTFEYDEWGNPAERRYHDYMLSYSPYDQVVAQPYPALLVTAGLFDPRVQYWEPAKWVAKLRRLKTNDAPLYLKTNMDAGHFDASGRFEHLRETALEYAFILAQTGYDG